jgi:LacI family transcriptional regulator
MKHPTVIDIAKKLGISPSTVSRALNDHPDCSPETKKRVKKAAAAVSYSPNPSAKILKGNRTTTIGIIVPEVKQDFSSSAISGIEEIAYHSGYTIVGCQSNESHEREVVNANALQHHRVAGVIFERACDDVGKQGGDRRPQECVRCGYSPCSESIQTNSSLRWTKGVRDL